MTERQPLKDRVKNILGLNLHDLTDMSGWTPEIRQGMALVEMSGEIDRLYDTGCGLHSGVCEQIRFLLRRWTLILGAVACLGVIGGLIALAVSIWSAAHAGVH